MKLIVPLLYLLFYLACSKSGAQPDQPHLRIETGVHSASVWRIASDEKAKYTVTASEDRTLRVWDTSSGALLKTIRAYYSGGNQGKFFAVDLSSDATLIAAGGKMSSSNDEQDWLYLYNRQTGEVVRKITNVPGRIFHVRFSPDGKYILAALERGKGIVLYETSSGRIITKDTDYKDDVYSAEFNKTGDHIATVSLDGYLRIYKLANMQSGPVEKKLIGDKPYSVSFSPKGNQLAIGCMGKLSVIIFPFAGGKTGEGRQLDIKRISNEPGNHLGMVCFSNNGEELYAAGNVRNRDDFQIIRKWRAGDGTFISDILLSNSATVLQLAAITENRILFATAAPDWGIIKPNGAVAFRTPVSVVDFSGQASSMLVSDDGMQVRLRLQKDSFNESVFSLANFTLRPAIKADTGYTLPFQSKEILKDWENSSEPVLNGKSIQLEANEVAYAAAITKQKPEGIVIGTDRFLRFYDLAGKLKWQTASPEVVWSVNITKDGKIVIAAFGDGTLRWYHSNDGKEIIAAFIHPDQKRWITWTPSGYYACSVNGEDLVGWQINNGPEKASDFFPVSKFRKNYYKPDLIKQLLAASESNVNSQPDKPEQLAQKTPPVVTILSPENNALAQTGILTVTYRIESNSPVKNTKVLVNGRPFAIQRGLKPLKNALTLQIPLLTEDIEVSILAENEHGFSVPSSVRVKNSGTQKAADKSLLPTLYVLAVGISNYKEQDLKLEFAAKDATDFTRLLIKQKGKLYGDVSVKLLTEKDASKEQILAGLKWLQTQTKPQDVAILFMAGHGFNDEKGEFYYLPVEANSEKLTQTALFFEDILHHITDVEGKIVFFIDACHSGNIMGSGHRQADMVRVANISASPENGIVVFTSSTGRQPSYEDVKWGNGAFTKAAVEGMDGKADLFKKGNVTIKGLDAYISDRVKDLTEGVQLPTTIVPQSIPDFQLLRLK